MYSHALRPTASACGAPHRDRPGEAPRVFLDDAGARTAASRTRTLAPRVTLRLFDQLIVDSRDAIDATHEVRDVPRIGDRTAHEDAITRDLDRHTIDTTQRRTHARL